MTTAFEARDAIVPQPSAGDLVAGYRAGPAAALFAGPTGTLLAEGVRQAVPDPADVARVLREAADRDTPGTADRPARPLVVGAIPFAPDRPAELFVPAAVHWAPPAADDPLLRLPRPRRPRPRGASSRSPHPCSTGPPWPRPSG